MTLGATKQPNNESTDIDPADRDSILERCAEVCPSVKVFMFSFKQILVHVFVVSFAHNI